MEFIDRLDEKARLDRLEAPGLAVLWGRRRVGKTRLLIEWNRARGGLYWVGDQSAEAIQRRYFAEALASRLPGFDAVQYPDWRTLFRALARSTGRGGFQGPLILDELPYLVAGCPALPSILQNWVDHEAKDAGILLVLAGSSQRMMHGLVMAAHAPLFGRASEAFELTPLSPGFLQRALRLGDPVASVEAYAVWGGIPWYWELASKFGPDTLAAVDSLVLDPAGPLHLEPDRLLREEQPSAAVLRPLLDAIGAGAHRPSEIAARVNQPVTSLARPLARLVELHLVRRESPFGESERSGKRVLYKIADPFFRFWFRTVAPHRGLLATSPKAARHGLARRAMGAIASETWEDLCRMAVPRLGLASLRGAGPFGPASRFWRGNGPEWDVVALSADGTHVLVGEAKWHGEEANTHWVDRAFRALARKGVPPVDGLRGKKVVYAVFVPQCSEQVGRQTLPYAVVDASDVMGALRG